MSRITNALLSGGYNKTRNAMLDAQYGGQGGWMPNHTEWISNQAYVSRPLVCIMLEAPQMFKRMPNPEKWIASLKALFELHPRSIEGLAAGLKVDTDEHAVGGAGEMQTEFVNVTRERSTPRFAYTEKYGRPIQNLLDFWIRYGMMDPETKFALLSTTGGEPMTDLLADWYSATCLFFEPDPNHQRVDKAWVVTNMFPTSNGDIVAKRDLTTSQEILQLDIEFPGISQTGFGVKAFAQEILDKINITNADPQMKPSFITDIHADVKAADTVGYKSWTEEVGRTAVDKMS